MKTNLIFSDLLQLSHMPQWRNIVDVGYFWLLIFKALGFMENIILDLINLYYKLQYLVCY